MSKSKAKRVYPSNAGKGEHLRVEYVGTALLIPDPRNARKHSVRQVSRIGGSIAEFGFTTPILVDERLKIIAGHGRVEAAKALGIPMVPCVQLRHLTEHQKTALAVADNKLCDMSDFDPAALTELLAELSAVDFSVELTGFETAEIDTLLKAPSSDSWNADAIAVEPRPEDLPVTRPGDLWQLNNHRLLVGDSLTNSSFELLLGSELADMAFVDAPYNVPTRVHFSGRGRASVTNSVMKTRKSSSVEFEAFLQSSMTLLAQYTTDSSIHFHCVDWRRLAAMLSAGSERYTEQKALCVWERMPAGMGGLYRPQHELIVVYKSGTSPHVNLNLGRNGRNRTNCSRYLVADVLPGGRSQGPAARSTAKPVDLVADAIRDCSKRGALVIDPFAGSGTTILAAEGTARRAAAVEIDPAYVDVAIRRWQAMTGSDAVLLRDGRTFEELEIVRLCEARFGE